MIRQVELDEYHVSGPPTKGRLIVKGGWYTEVVLVIVDDDGSEHRAQVVVRDLERAIEATRAV